MKQQETRAASVLVMMVLVIAMISTVVIGIMEIATEEVQLAQNHIYAAQAVEEIPYKEVSDTAQGGQAALTSTRFKEVGVTLQVTAGPAPGQAPQKADAVDKPGALPPVYE